MTDDNNHSKDLIGKNLRAAFSDTVEEGVPKEFQELIDKNLKKAFDDTIDEGVPDRFSKLLEQLKDVTTGDDA